MKNKYSERLFSNFPNNLGFVNDPNDPLHILINSGGRFLGRAENIINNNINNLYIDTANPTLPYEIYYVELDNIRETTIVPIAGSDAQIVDNETDFLSDMITGFEHLATISPSGIPSSGMLGISYGFHWDNPSCYVTVPNDPSVYKYENMDFSKDPMGIDYSLDEQSYNAKGRDEYLNIQNEISELGIPDLGIPPSGIVKVAYLQHTPSGTVTIIDVDNLQDPRNPDSDGIVVNQEDYIVEGNKIFFARERRDFVPAEIINVGEGSYINYPPNYQPDRYFESTFIAEYKYRKNDNPKQLCQRNSWFNLGLDEDPIASF